MTSRPALLHDVAPGVWSTARIEPNAAQQVRALGWDAIELDLWGASDHADVLDRLGTAGAFPPHYGRNWDAAYDCLTDLSWRPTAPRVLLVRGPIDPMLRGVLDDTAREWAHSTTPLWVVVQGDGAPSLDDRQA